MLEFFLDTSLPFVARYEHIVQKLTEHGENPWRSRRCNRLRIPYIHCQVQTWWEGWEEDDPGARRRVAGLG